MQVKESLWSELEVKKIGDTSVLTANLVYKPLKTFALQRGNACQIVFSNYGGGYVEGDQICLKLDCLPDTTTLLSSQANTRIYKSVNGGVTRQKIQVNQREGSFVAYVGDALVPQKESIFEQQFHWNLEKDAVLLFVDWFEAGRILTGERFAFHTFGTELKVQDEKGIVVLDRFKIDPHGINVNSPGAFLNHTSYMNVFLIGDENLTRVRLLENHLRFTAKKHFQEDQPLRMDEFELIGSAAKINERVFLIRCSAKENEALALFERDLAAVLEMKELLGFHPLERKY
jgi:urease accessory protein